MERLDEHYMTKRFGKNDAVFLGILLFVITAGIVFYYAFFQKAGNQVEITVDGEYYRTYDLDKEETFDIAAGEDTTNTLTIKDGSAQMIWADCPDKLCMHQKAISKSGETIVCLPNKVVAEVMGEDNQEFDSFVN